MTQNQPRQINKENLHQNVWNRSTEVVPPDGIRVLCTDDTGEMWFDTYIQGCWASPIAPNKFAWMLVARPIDMFFDL